MLFYIFRSIDKVSKENFSKKNRVISAKSNELKEYVDSLKNKFTGSNYYLDYNFELECVNDIEDSIKKYKTIYNGITFWDRIFDKYYMKTSFEHLINKNLNFLKEIDVKKYRIEANNLFIESHKKKFAALFNNVENRKLDEKQQECIIKDELNNLVVAGAGSGKTTTIVGKVKYLINVLNYSPQEILIISFTKKSAHEMKNRIEKSIQCKNINAMTFHSLGLKITRSIEGSSKIVSDQAKIINNLIKEFLDIDRYKNKFNEFFLEHLTEYKSQFEFETLREYTLYLKENRCQSIDGKVFRSMEEVTIANFLYMNNVDYEYEKEYPHVRKYKYKPDFYLTKFDIYIEHFGIARDGSVPKFFSGGSNSTPSEKYHNGMRWKRKIHKENNTKLIETYSYQRFEGNLISNLKRELLSNGVDVNVNIKMQKYYNLKLQNFYKRFYQLN